MIVSYIIIKKDAIDNSYDDDNDVGCGGGFGIRFCNRVKHTFRRSAAELTNINDRLQPKSFRTESVLWANLPREHRATGTFPSPKSFLLRHTASTLTLANCAPTSHQHFELYESMQKHFTANALHGI